MTYQIYENKIQKTLWGTFALKIYEAYTVDQIKGQPHQKSSIPHYSSLF